jgi:hypothetical protein
MVLVGKPEGKRLFGRPRCRREKILKWMLEKWDEGGALHLLASQEASAAWSELVALKLEVADNPTA